MKKPLDLEMLPMFEPIRRSDRRPREVSTPRGNHINSRVLGRQMVEHQQRVRVKGYRK